LTPNQRAPDEGGQNPRQNQKIRKPDMAKIECATIELEKKLRTKISEENHPKQEHNT
jgi:hypothetical protein